ncbi:MAG TPA: hypothetical protein VGI21_23010, partial [Streptosporangiaceae bacterium]
MTLFTAATLTACAASGPAGTHASGPAGAATARPSSPGPAQEAALGPQRVGSPSVAHVPAPRTKAPAAPSRAPASNGTGIAAVPAAGQPVSIAHPDHVIGDGTAASCTSQAVVDAVAAGGVITFSCGSEPVTITMAATAKVRNTSSAVVLDGQGKVTLSGGGARRILYQDTCDPAQAWATSHCQDQATPHLTVQNMTFANGNSTGQSYDGGGGGAIFDRGGQLTVINSRFTGNRCDSSGPDLGGAAIRALSQYQNQPVYVVGSTFTG